jgi:hypothetical protein
MTSFKVRDGRERIIEFDGKQIAEISSERPDSPRWMVMKIYKTNSGTYVLEKIGASRVVHMPGCTEPFDDLPRFQDMNPGEDPFTPAWWQCRTCCDVAGVTVDMTALQVEENRYTGFWSDNPQDVIEELYRKKGGARVLQRMAVDLLEEASDADEGIAKAYRSVYLV